jgi:hypothetical protein
MNRGESKDQEIKTGAIATIIMVEETIETKEVETAIATTKEANGDKIDLPRDHIITAGMKELIIEDIEDLISILTPKSLIGSGDSTKEAKKT